MRLPAKPTGHADAGHANAGDADAGYATGHANAAHDDARCAGPHDALNAGEFYAFGYKTFSGYPSDGPPGIGLLPMMQEEQKIALEEYTQTYGR
jgi:hypothetical protein